MTKKLEREEDTPDIDLVQTEGFCESGYGSVGGFCGLLAPTEGEGVCQLLKPSLRS
jgi:hypothetical protein